MLLEKEFKTLKNLINDLEKFLNSDLLNAEITAEKIQDISLEIKEKLFKLY